MGKSEKKRFKNVTHFFTFEKTRKSKIEKSNERFYFAAQNILLFKEFTLPEPKRKENPSLRKTEGKSLTRSPGTVWGNTIWHFWCTPTARQVKTENSLFAKCKK